jgi:hypothetical protein
MRAVDSAPQNGIEITTHTEISGFNGLAL